MRLAAATALISSATLGSYMATSDGSDHVAPTTVATPTYTGSSISSSSTAMSGRVASSGVGSTLSVVPHTTLGSSGSGTSAAAASAGSSTNYSGSRSTGSKQGMKVATSTSSTSGSGSGAGSAGGGGTYATTSRSAAPAVSGSMSGATSLALAAASAPRRSSMSEPGASTPTIPDVYDGDAPGVITGTENYNLDNTLIDNYGQPIGDAVLPLMILAMLFGWSVGRKKKLKEVR